MQAANALALLKKGIKFTFVVGSRHILSQNIDDDCAAILQKRLESQGYHSCLGEAQRALRRRITKSGLLLIKVKICPRI